MGIELAEGGAEGTPEAAPDDSFKGRVIRERDQLAENKRKLGEFLKSEQFETLPLAERQRLSTQFSVQGVLLDVLSERINADFQ